MITTRYQKITIISSRRPRHDINTELQWFGNSLGLFNLRDKDKSCFRIFIELLKSTKLKKPLTSDEIAAKLSLSRGTVVHHITKLIESGMVVIEDGKYLLRVDNLEVLIDELEKDLERMLSELRAVAKDIDTHLRL